MAGPDIVLLGVPVYFRGSRSDGSEGRAGGSAALRRVGLAASCSPSTTLAITRVPAAVRLIARQVVGVDPLHFFGVRAARRRAASRAAEVVDDDEVILDAAVRVPADAIEHFDDGSDVHVEAGLLAHFADQSRLERLAQLDGAARQAPFALERLVRALDQQHAVAVEDHGADADDRTVRESPHILTSSTFLVRHYPEPSQLPRTPHSDPHHLDHHALLPLAVELGVEDLLPRAEIEAPSVIGSIT